MGNSHASEKLVNGHVFGIRRLLAEIGGRVATERVGLRRVDVEVVRDFLDLAGACAGSALLALHPEWDDLDDERFEDAIRAFEEEHRSERKRPKDDPREDLDFVNVFVMLLAHGVIANVVEWPDDAGSQEIIDEMENVIEVMAFVGYVLDSQAAVPEDLSGEERSLWIARREEFADVLTEARERATVTLGTV